MNKPLIQKQIPGHICYNTCMYYNNYPTESISCGATGFRGSSSSEEEFEWGHDPPPAKIKITSIYLQKKHYNRGYISPM